jgi:tRNA-2-methylthio-N6-dimethylallyladenosine synthase
VRGLVEQGVTEVTLLGQTSTAYNDGAADFADLLKAVGAVDGYSPDPIHQSVSDRLYARVIEAMATTRRFCEHVHLPVQSGSNAVLKRMLRRYTRRAIPRKSSGRPAGCHPRLSPSRPM